MSDDPYVRPDTRLLLDLIAASGRPPVETLDPAAARAVSLAARAFLETPVGELATIVDHVIDAPGGPIAIRLFDSRDRRDAGDVIIYYHGGGFVIGSIDSHASLCAELSRLADLPVVSVEYRLAPEHPFPAAPDDALAAARWIAAHGDAIGRVASRLVLIGDSAGANLAVVTAAQLRDDPAAVPVAAQALIYPVTSDLADEGSGRDFAEGYVLTRTSLDWFDGHYRPANLDRRRNPWIAGLAGMPPTVIVTAGLDPLRDQGRALAGGLAAQGVPTVYLEARGNIHAFATMRKALPSSQADIAAMVDHLTLLLETRA